MAVNVATLTAKLEADIRDFDRDMRTANRRLDALEGNTQKASKGLGGMSTAMKGLAAAAAAAGLAQFGKQVVMLASDAEEAASAFGTTFGKSVDRAAKFVDEWATSAGFARHELQQLMATTGNIVQGIGATEDASAELSESMARLAGDVASFSNAAGGAPAVLKALQSAITGEREALKTYGIVLSETDIVQQALLETGKESADELTRLEKATATVTLAYERAGKAVGDLERTQDGFANTLRRVNAEWTEAKVVIGKALLPLAADLLPALSAGAVYLADFGMGLSEIIGWISALPGPVKIAAGAIGGLATALTLASAHPVIAGLTLVAGAVTLIGRSARQHQQDIDGWVDALMQVGEASKTATREMAAQRVVELEMGANLRRLGLDVDDLVGYMRGEVEAVNKVDAAILAHKGTVSGMDQQTVEFESDLRELTGTYRDAAEEAAQLKDEQREASLLLAGDAHIAWHGHTEDVQATVRALDDTGYQIFKVMSLTSSLADENDKASRATDKHRMALEGLDSQMRRMTDPIFRMQDAVARLEELQSDAEASARDLAEAQLEVWAAESALAAMGADAAGGLDLIARALEAAGVDAEAAAEYMAMLNAQLGIAQAFSGLRIRFDAPFGADVFRAEGGRTGGAKRTFVPEELPLGGFATGGVVPGPIGAPQLAMVHGGETILPTHTDSFSGSNITINVTSDMTDPGAARRFVRDVAEELENYRAETLR